jgi:hypothetical protein
MIRRQPPGTLIVTLSPAILDRLISRGARSVRAHGPLCYTRQLARSLRLFESVLLRSDPRETQGLPETHYDLLLDLLADPLHLEAFHIQRLGEYLSELPHFASRARELGLDPADLEKTVTGFTFAEKLHLVDAAQIRHAPPPRRAGAR